MTVAGLTDGSPNGDLDSPVSSSWPNLVGTTGERIAAPVHATAHVAGPTSEPEPAPLLEVCVDLAPGMQTRMDRCVGDVPLLEVITGRARLVVSFDVGEVTMLDAEHVALAEAFANAACELRNELHEVVAARDVAGGQHG